MPSDHVPEPAAAEPEPEPTPGLDSLFDFLPIGAYRSRPDGTMMRANPALVALNGYTTESELLAAVHDIATEWYVDPKRRAEFQRLLEADGEVRGFVSQVHRHRSRERIWISENAHAIRDSAGRMLCYEGTVEDVSARVAAEAALRDSEEQLRSVTNQIPGVVFKVHVTDDRRRVFNFVSAGVREMYGLEPAAVYADGELLERHRHPEDRERIEIESEAARRHNAPMGSEYRIVRVDGTVRWVRLTSTALQPDPSGRGHFRIGVVVDISERKQSEALRQERDRAELAQRHMSEFLSRVSHELRTPLNAVLGFAQLMQMSPDTAERQRPWVAEMLNSGRHLLGLVDDVLDLTGAQSGQMSFELAPVALPEVLAEAWAMLAAGAAEAGLSFDDLASGAAMPPVLADRRRLRQVLTNLLSNAVKYNKAGGQVAVSARVDGEQMVIDVSDTGIGIEAAQVTRLFMPFDRLGAQRSKVAGTGLGLALSRQLLLGMGGLISARSQPGLGSTFSVRLPLAAGSVIEPRPQPQP